MGRAKPTAGTSSASDPIVAKRPSALGGGALCLRAVPPTRNRLPAGWPEAREAREAQQVEQVEQVEQVPRPEAPEALPKVRAVLGQQAAEERTHPSEERIRRLRAVAWSLS